MVLTQLKTAAIADDAVTTDKLANAINTERTANTAKTTNATHTGDVTGSGSLTIADNAVTLAKMAGGTDGQIITYDASGDPVAVGPGTDGQVLTSTGAGSPPAFETPSAGGITEADSWRITVDITGDAVPISSNWERGDTSPWEGNLGTGLTESSGIFTFPSTGWWFVIWHHYFRHNGASYWNEMAIELSNDSGSNWTQLANSEAALYSATGTNHWHKATESMLVDITNVSTQKMRFRIDVDDNAVVTASNSTKRMTGFDIFRLGDT